MIYTMIIFCVQKKTEVSSDMLSKYCSDIADKYRKKVSGVKKLIPNLGNKTKYVLQKSSKLFITGNEID